MTKMLPRLGRRALLALPFAAGAAHAATSITDVLGRKVVLKAPPERIVVGFNFEEFTAVAGPQGWQRVVGLSRSLWEGWRTSSFRRYSAVLPNLAGLPEIGNAEDGNFNMEALLALRPDLLIMPQWGFSVLSQQMAQLEALGVPVVVIDYNAQDPAKHVASTRAIASATGNEARGEALAQLYLSSLADIRARAAKAGTHPRVYVELGQAGPGSIGNTYTTGMWGRILDLIGAQNIATGRIAAAWGPQNPEYILAANPEAVFIAGSSWANRPQAVITGCEAEETLTRARLAAYARRDGWDRLDAVRNGQVFAIEHGLCRSLWDFTAIQFIAKGLWPAAFADVYPVAALAKYHADWLPVRFEGTWMTRLGPHAS